MNKVPSEDTFEFLLPDLGEGIAEAEVMAWHAEPGDEVKAHQVLVEVQTDKAMVELPSPVDGILLAQGAAVGQMISHGGLVATIATSPGPALPKGRSPEPVEALAESQVPAQSESHRPLAAPTVRRLAKELAVDLETVRGTGPGDRITRDDVEHAVAANSVSAPDRVVPAGDRTRDAVTRIPLRGLRRTIARKMSETWRTVPSVTNMLEIDVTELEHILSKLQPVAAAQDVRLTWTALFASAVIRALRDFPQLNASLDEARDEIVQHHNIHLGIATAVPDGLLVPVIANAQGLSLLELAAAIARVGDTARTGTATRAELSGGTFTLSNYGAVGGWFGTPMVNLPEIAIVGFGRVETRPAVLDGAVVPRRLVAMSATADHRVIDGSVLAQFGTALRGYIEQPYLLMLGAFHGDG